MSGWNKKQTTQCGFYRVQFQRIKLKNKIGWFVIQSTKFTAFFSMCWTNFVHFFFFVFLITFLTTNENADCLGLFNLYPEWQIKSKFPIVLFAVLTFIDKDFDGSLFYEPPLQFQSCERGTSFCLRPITFNLRENFWLTVF